MHKLVLTIIIISFFTSCEKEVQKKGKLADQFSEWIDFYSEDGAVSDYSATTGQIVKSRVLITNVDNLPNLADCQVDGRTEQCEYLTCSIEFMDIDSNVYNLAIFVGGQNTLWVIPSSQAGLSTPIFRWNENDQVVDYGYSGVFEVYYDSEYEYNNEILEAFIINQLERTELFGQQIAPKKSILAKGQGIILWEDFSGNTYDLR
jgi:hypothetical protein